jgi:glycosyltransferase involved in cell wall biosynthesis
MGDDRIQVWLFITSLVVGGAERTLVTLANNIDRSRFDVTVWTMFEENPLAADIADDVPVRTLGGEGVPVGDEKVATIEGAENPLDYVRLPLRFVRELRAERPDVLQSFLVYDNTVARLAGLFAPGTAVVTGARGERNLSDPVPKALDRGLLPLSDHIASNSQTGADFYAERGMPREDIVVVRNGRDLDRYREGTAEGLREEFEIPADALVVGNVGRLLERKGQFDLLAAWPAVKAAHPNAHCVLVGDGEARDALVDRIDELGCGESVHLAGTRNDVPALLDLMDVFAFPSHHEGLPGALLEAMAAGLPIAASSIPGNQELIAHGENGLLVPPNDSEALAEAIDTLAADTERARTLAEQAQSDAYENYSHESMVEGFESLYESIASVTNE